MSAHYLMGSKLGPDQVLSDSAGEQAQLRATLAAAGYSDSDLSYQQGQWRLGSPPVTGESAASGAAVRDTTGSARKIEDELRTLYVAAYTLLTPSERMDKAMLAKTASAFKRSRAFPGDDETEFADSTLNPFAEWPWEQGLRVTVTPDLPYKRAGRLLWNALRWCNKFCTCPVMKTGVS